MDVSRSTAELAESAVDWMPFLQLLDVCVWERKADSWAGDKDNSSPSSASRGK